MKKYLFFFLLTFLLTPQISQANNFDTRINFTIAYFEATDECAIETEIKGIDGGLLNGTEAILINGIEWANTQELVDAHGDSGYQVGDKISWGTSALSTKLNYGFDIQLRADYCQNLQLGDTLSYRTSFGNEVSAFTIGMPLMLTSWNFSANTGLYDTWDLATNTITIEGYDSNITIVDGVPQGSTNNGNGGCSLVGIPSGATGLGAWGMFGFLILAISLKRLAQPS